MTIDEMIAVLQAAKAGKVVEHKSFCGWSPITWFNNYQWRVKPEPREFWITTSGHVWTVEQYAKDWFRGDEDEYNRRVIHVREVL